MAKKHILTRKITNKEYEILDDYMRIPMADFEALRLELYILLGSHDIYEYSVACEDKVAIYPKEIRQRIVDKEESPVRIFRDYRKMTQSDLANKVGVDKSMISHIENGNKKGSTKTLLKIAKALNMDLNDLF